MRTAWLLALLALLLEPPGAQALDEARALMGVDRARTEYGVTGHRVVIGIIDRGIDHTHPGFRNPDGTTRILAMLDLTDDAGAKAQDNPHGVGTILRKPAIDRALKDGTKLSTDDDEGRGTASAGIACGNGRGSKGGRQRGIAPNARMLVVKLKADPSPWRREARGERAAVEEQGKNTYFDLKRLRTAMDFCVAEAHAVGLPVVMLMNFGQLGGPTDGGSKLCRVIDETVGPKLPGRALVTGTSDMGDRKNRARGRVTQGGSVTLPVEKEGEGELFVDIWYPGSDRFDVSIRTPKGTFGPFKAPKTGKSEYTSEFQYYHLASSRNQVLTLGGKRQIRVDLIAGPGRYDVTLHGAKVASGVFDATLSPNPENPMEEPFNKFLAHTAPGSLWDGASARHAIVVGCSVLRSEWKNVQGRSLYQLGEGKPGELWLGSGTGPTTDGRHGVTLCAPGDRIATTYAPNAEWASIRRHVMSDTGGMYGLSSGTTAAAALVAGVVALMFEIDPQLDGATARTILAETARQTAHSGAVPNPAWGHGMVDTFAALGRVDARKRGADRK